MSSLSLSSLDYAVRCSLVSLVDELVCIVLRDGRSIIGRLRAFDQYSNIVLSGAIERRVLPSANSYCDSAVGLECIRGESVAAMCIVRNDAMPQNYAKVTPEELAALSVTAPTINNADEFED